ncbi:MAG: hypothetical protein JO019_04445, partial [Candidatus Kaiserbacteria bacterium]|nr:hypothetical protein [Candidatus Kaiserbacteria bacterium]
VLSAPGTYDYGSNTLAASALTIFQAKDVFVSKNFQGTLKALAGTNLPTTLTVTIDGVDYTVYLTAKTSILNNKKASVGLYRFAAGDTVRLYGKIRETNLSEIDAEVVRDTSF